MDHCRTQTLPEQQCRIVGRLIPHDKIRRLAQLVGQSLDSHGVVFLSYLALNKLPCLRTTSLIMIGSLHIGPCQVSVAVLAVVVAFLFAV